MIGLRPYQAQESASLLRWIDSEAALVQWAGESFRWPLDQAQLDAYLAGAAGTPPTRLIWTAIAEAGGEAGEIVGHICLNQIDQRNRKATISRVLIEPQARGRALCTPLIEAVLGVAFDELGLHRVDLIAFDFNRPALACYERAGFRLEGQLREDTLVGGEWWSTSLMSILEEEWRRQHP